MCTCFNLIFLSTHSLSLADDLLAHLLDLSRHAVSLLLPFALLVGDLEICLLEVTSLCIHLLLLGLKDLLKLRGGALHGRSLGHGLLSLCLEGGQLRGERLDLLVLALALGASGLVELRDQLLDPRLQVLVLLLEFAHLGGKVAILLPDNLAFPLDGLEGGKALCLVSQLRLHLSQLGLVVGLGLLLGGLELKLMVLCKLLNLPLILLVQLVLLGLQIDGMHSFQVFDVTSELPDVRLMFL